MSGLFGASQNPTITPPNYIGIPVQTSASTMPITVGWGTGRLAPNLIDYLDFQQNSSSSSSGGKGGGGKSGGADYSATIVLALCEGAIAHVTQIWIDMTNTTSLSTYGFILSYGSLGQAPWGYLSSQHAAHAVNYAGTAYVSAENYDLGSTPDVPNHNFEVVFSSAGNATWLNSQDADMALIIQDFLTNPQYGIPNFPSAVIDTTTLLSGADAATTGDASVQTWCRANGWAFSPILDTQETGTSILQRWCQITSVAPVWSDKLLKFKPYGDTPITAHGVTYQPDLDPVYDLDDGDFIDAGGDDDPLTIGRVDETTAYNKLRMEVLDRPNYYNPVPVEVRDQAAIEDYGERLAQTITAHEICDVAKVGQPCAQLILQRMISIRKTPYSFKLGVEFCLLEPMDLVTLTDPLLRLDHEVVRIIEIDEDEDGNFEVQAEEFPQGIAQATVYPTLTVSNTPNNAGVQVSPVNAPVIFEPPLALSGTPQVWIAASASLTSGADAGQADPLWGGCQVWIGTDTSSFQNVGSITGAARMGVLTAALAAYDGADPDTGDTLSVDLQESGGTLDGTSALNASNGVTLCWVANETGDGGEFLAFENATLAAGPTYTLTGLYRGFYNSGAGAHAAGARFARLDDALFKYAIPSRWVGQTIYVKLVSFNVFGGGVGDISAATIYSYQLGSSAVQPAAPASLSVTGGVQEITLSWPAPNDTSIQGTRIFGVIGEDANFADAAILAQVTGTSWTHNNLGFGQSWTYWIEYYNASASSDPTGPASAVTSYDISADGLTQVSSDPYIQALTARIGGTEDAATAIVGALAQQQATVNALLTQATNQLAAFSAGLVLVEQTQRTALQVQVNGNTASIASVSTVAETATASIATLSTTLGADYTDTEDMTGAITDAKNNAIATAATNAASAIAANNATLATEFDAAGSAATAQATAISTAATNAASAIAANNVTLAATYITPAAAASAATSIADSAVATAVGGLATYTLQLQATTTGGMLVMAGFELVASGATAQSEVLIAADKFGVATYDLSGDLNANFPFLVSGTDVYFTGFTHFENLVGGTITTGNLIVDPAASGDGMQVYQYNSSGNVIIFDSVTGLYPGSATGYYSWSGSPGSTVSVTGSGSTTATTSTSTIDLVTSGTFTASGRVEYVSIGVNLTVGGSSPLYEATLQVEVDGTVYATNAFPYQQLNAAEVLTGLVAVPALSSGSHSLSVSITLEAIAVETTTSYVTLTSWNVELLDQKA